MTTVRLMDSLRRHAALGIRFWDFATGNTIVGGLSVSISPRSNPGSRSPLLPNHSGVYVAHSVPGLRDFEFSTLPPTRLWATPSRPYRVDVTDPVGRFLPSRFDVDLPRRGLLDLLVPWLSPGVAATLPLDPGSPPQALVGMVPLFSAPSRPVPEPLGVVRAQLREQVPAGMGPRTASWLLMAVAIDGRQRGLGLADAEGRVAVLFGYPDPPRRQLTSPPQARNDFSWELTLSALGSGSPTATDAPDLAVMLEQLSQPRQVLESLHSPAQPLRLEYRVPLTVRTAGAMGDDASYLFLAA